MDFSTISDTVSDFNGFKMYEFKFDGCDCKIVEPKEPLPGKRWIWKAEYFHAFQSFETEMLNRGYYYCYMKTEYAFGSPATGKHWDKFYELLTEKYGFARKALLFGLSVGGLYIYNWAVNNTDKISCLYADNPVCDIKSWPGGKGCGPGSPDHWQKLFTCYGFASEAEALAWRGNPVDTLKVIVDAGIPLIHAAAIEDEVVPITENTDVMEKNCLALGGKITVFRHHGHHHPHHGVDDFKLLIDTIVAADESNR